MDHSDVQAAMDVLRKAMREDPAYAYGWHANIAMACKDAIEDQKGIKDLHVACNDGAGRFMARAFDIKTSQEMLGD